MENKEKWLHKLVEIMKHLRSPDGCPWDRKQTLETLKPCIMEECAELMDAVDDQDSVGIREELGDLLMHVVLHSQIASEQGMFDLYDVAETICEKMIRRHPHVFGDDAVASAEEVPGLWEKVKAQEKPDRFESVLDGVPRNLPPIMKTIQIQKKAAKAGFEWESQYDVLHKIEEELAEVHEAIESGDSKAVDEEIGDLLFAVVCLTRFRGGRTADDLLNDATAKFSERFKLVESHFKEKELSMKDVSGIELKKTWCDAKIRLEK